MLSHGKKFHRTPRRQFFLEILDAVGKRHCPCCSVMRVSAIASVGYVRVVQTRKVEGWMVVSEERNLTRPEGDM